MRLDAVATLENSPERTHLRWNVPVLLSLGAKQWFGLPQQTAERRDSETTTVAGAPPENDGIRPPWRNDYSWANSIRRDRFCIGYRCRRTTLCPMFTLPWCCTHMFFNTSPMFLPYVLQYPSDVPPFACFYCSVIDPWHPRVTIWTWPFNTKETTLLLSSSDHAFLLVTIVRTKYVIMLHCNTTNTELSDS